MKLGYARVSSQDQNLARQIEALEKAGAEKIFEEKVSGASMENRDQLKKLLKYAREKDTLIVDSLDRLGRNYDDIIDIVQSLDKKEISLVVLNLPVLSQEIGDTSISKLLRNFIVQILAWTAENERNEIKRKQAQGIMLAKEKGIYKGRPRTYSANARDSQKRTIYEQIVEYLNVGNSVSATSKKYNVARNTVYRIKNELNIK